MNPNVLASYTQNIAQGQKNDSRINAVYSGCLVVRVGGSRLGVGLIKCCDFQRSLLARSISDPSVLATRGAYVFIFSLCCLLSVCNVFTTPRYDKCFHQLCDQSFDMKPSYQSEVPMINAFINYVIKAWT